MNYTLGRRIDNPIVAGAPGRPVQTRLVLLVDSDSASVHRKIENIGVIPDEVSLRSADDLAAGRDVTLARAAELLGVSITPEDAGKLFPVQWLN